MNIKNQLETYLAVEVWDWDKFTANDYIGGFAVKIDEIIELTKLEPHESWYKLLDEKRAKTQYEKILADSEACKVWYMAVCQVHVETACNHCLYVPLKWRYIDQEFSPATITKQYICSPLPACLHLPQLIEEFRKATIQEKTKNDPNIQHIRRPSDLVPGASKLPTMKLDDFNLLVVLGKGSFGKVSTYCVHSIVSAGACSIKLPSIGLWI